VVQAVLVGCGAMSKAWLEAARQINDVTITGLVDLDVDRAHARAREFGLDGVAIGTDLDAILKQTRPDVVFDVVVPSARREVALTAFANSCHLLTEKPLADSLDGARDIITAARAAKRIHAVVQNRRYLADVRRIRRLLESEALGAPTSIHCDFFLAPHFGGFREEMDHVLLVDMAIHTFDAARYMINREPHRVYCHEWDPRESWYRRGSSAVAIFEMSGGVAFTYRGSWCANGLRTSWESEWRIVCERGSVAWDGYDDLQAEVTNGTRDGLFDQVEPIEVPPLDPRDRVGGHLGVMQDFITAVREGCEPETVGTDNAKSLAMVFAATRSAETGSRVDIETRWS
jgi:predicted dehydrogenase